MTVQPGGSAYQYTLSTCLYPQSGGLCEGKRKGKGTVVFLRGSRSIAPPIVSLGTRWRQMVNFTLWLIYGGVKTPEYLLNRTLGGPQSLSELFFRGKYLAGNRALDHPAYPSHYTE